MEIKFWINRRQPGMIELADRMRKAGIEFFSLPTSGCTSLWHGSATFHGPTAVTYAVEAWLKQKVEKELKVARITQNLMFGPE